jgi:putative transposase
MAATGARIGVPVAVACRVPGLSAQGYYKWLKGPVCQRDWDDAHALNVLHDIHGDDPTLGYRFLTDELEDAGIVAGENRVARLCQLAGIMASHTARRARQESLARRSHDDLLAIVDDKGRVRHEFPATAVNQIWLSGITEHRTAEGKLSLCAIRDCFSNKIVGYSIDSRMKASPVAAALRNAVALREPIGTIFHSDRGRQFRSKRLCAC